MKIIKTDIIPKSATFVKVDKLHELDYKAICCFVATGFFLDTDTYWKDKKVLAPGTINTVDSSNRLLNTKPWFKWYSKPRNLSFIEAIDEFSELFEEVVREQTKNRNVILPLSGGLDSRTQATALRNHPNVNSYSYNFKNGYPETQIAQEIAHTLDFSFKSYQVKPGYLWHCIEELAEINHCFSEFSHPRQMCCIKDVSRLGEVFSLGHMGDLLFDSMHLPQLTFNEEVELVMNKFVKNSGHELALLIWESWGLSGDFDAYLRERVASLLSRIEINETNAKLRAFKSMYLVTRWSSNNLSVFESVAPIELPYYDNRMYDFVCSLPEAYLSGRKLQIAYIKRYAPKLAEITWQEKRPFNLYNYENNTFPNNLPYRISNKCSRVLNSLIGKPHVSRNWELQFLGKQNDIQLKRWLFDENLNSLMPASIISEMYDRFKNKNTVNYSHAVSMLLTLALFNKKFNLYYIKVFIAATMSNKKIKILYTIPNFDTAGSGKVVYDLVNNLDRTIFQPEICCFHNRGAYFKVIESLEVKIHLFDFAINYRPFITFPFRVLNIVKFFKKHHFDVIHSWHWSSDFSEPLAAKLVGIPFVYTKKSMGWGNTAWKWRSHLSSKIITINSDMKTLFSNKTLKKVTPISLGVDTSYYGTRKKTFGVSESLKFDENDFIIVSVVNFIPVKGLEILIQAVNEIDNTQIKLCFVGNDTGDYADGLKKLAAENPNIYFLGKQLDVRPYLALADLFVIPTLKLGEGLPMAPMEAMASGLMVLGSRVPGVKDLLEAFPNYLFAPNDVEDLKKKINSVNNLSSKQRCNIGKEMQAYVIKHFSKQHFVESHETLYKSMVG